MNFQKLTKFAFAFYVAMHLFFWGDWNREKHHSTLIAWLINILNNKCCSTVKEIEIKKFLFWRDYNLLNSNCQCLVGEGNIRIHRSMYYVPTKKAAATQTSTGRDLINPLSFLLHSHVRQLAGIWENEKWAKLFQCRKYLPVWSLLSDISISKLLEGQSFSSYRCVCLRVHISVLIFYRGS